MIHVSDANTCIWRCGGKWQGKDCCGSVCLYLYCYYLRSYILSDLWHSGRLNNDLAVGTTKFHTEMLFHMAHYNLMAGHLGVDKIVAWSIGHLLGQASVKICTVQLVNPLAISKVPLLHSHSYQDPLWKNWHRFHQAITYGSTGISFCISSVGKCGTISQSHASEN